MQDLLHPKKPVLSIVKKPNTDLLHQTVEVKEIANDTDLVWELDHIDKPADAIEFVKRFENKFCVYAPTVNQLYTKYQMFFPPELDKKMVVLPDPFAFHDTFSRVQSSAIIDTGIIIIPGERIGEKGLFVLQKKQDGTWTKPYPFKDAIRLILKSARGNSAFLPVLMKGDLREFDSKMPCLHLHALSISKLESLSNLERNGLKNAIGEKLIQVYREF